MFSEEHGLNQHGLTDLRQSQGFVKVVLHYTSEWNIKESLSSSYFKK